MITQEIEFTGRLRFSILSAGGNESTYCDTELMDTKSWLEPIVDDI